MGITVNGRIPKDKDRAPVLGTLSYLDGATVVPIYGDPSTGAILTSVVSGGGGGTQYTDGVAQPTYPIGNALVYGSGTNMVAVTTSNPLPITGTVAVTQSGTWNVGLSAGSNAIGSITNTSFAATQATASSLNATVVGTGTFAVQATLQASATTAIGTVGTTSAAINVGQQTVNTTAVQVSSSSTVPTNGILIGALSTNSASIFVGGSGVTTSTGVELVPGASMPFTANLNTLYIRSVASTTDKIWYNVT